MAYGVESLLFLDGREARTGRARHSRSARAWRGLSEQSRLELVEKALGKPANDDWPEQTVPRPGERA
ncbi:MAG TPA: hypothetical protein VFK50_06400 [Sphingomicrobium sp.]|nr:hypothetical protein [Sphingomicrobium sp.]